MNLKFFKKIVQKNRLQAYKEVLIYAKENGYIITWLIDWYDNYINSDKKILILRHDVDYDAKGALEMFKIEKELGLKSTFYFRWLTADYSIMKAINNAGFEVSLHYETLATYAKNNNITKTDEVTPDILNLCFNNLIDEIKEFEQRFWKVNTICSHGDKVNRQLKVSNYKIINIAKLNDLGIKFNVYNKDIMDKFDSYISDSSIYSNFEWKHSGSPYNAIDKEHKIICLLTHPIHWNQGFFKNIQMLQKIYADNK